MMKSQSVTTSFAWTKVRGRTLVVFSPVRRACLLVGVVVGLFVGLFGTLSGPVRAAGVADLSVRTWLDEEVTLAALIEEAEEAKVQGLTLVNVWAAWCPPCREELPLLLEGHRSGRYRLITINLGDHPDQVARFLHTQALETLPSYFLSVRDAGLLGLQGLPTTLVFGAREKQLQRLQTVHGPLNPDSLDALLLNLRD